MTSEGGQATGLRSPSRLAVWTACVLGSSDTYGGSLILLCLATSWCYPFASKGNRLPSEKLRMVHKMPATKNHES